MSVVGVVISILLLSLTKIMFSQAERLLVIGFQFRTCERTAHNLPVQLLRHDVTSSWKQGNGSYKQFCQSSVRLW